MLGYNPFPAISKILNNTGKSDDEKRLEQARKDYNSADPKKRLDAYYILKEQ